jgi:host factor-I protein
MRTDEQCKLQDAFLEVLCKNNIPVSVFLISGIKLQGYLDRFDDCVLILKNSLTQTVVGQMVYKQAVSTIMPIYPVELPANACS